MDPVLSGISLRDAGTALLDLAMPRRCIACGRPLGLRERFLCLPCMADFPFTHHWELSHNPMADKFNARLQEDLDALAGSLPSISPSASSPASSISSTFSSSLSSSALSSSPASSVDSSPASSSSLAGSSPAIDGFSPPHEPYAFAAALFFYNSASDYRRIPWHLKYEGGLAAGRYFARMLGERLAASPQFADVDVVIPVPLHWTRQSRRGYNQAEVIARELADVLGAELRTDILRRSRRTRTQVRLPMAAKAANVRGAFSLRSSAFRPSVLRHSTLRSSSLRPSALSSSAPQETICIPDTHNMRVRHILLVDDTFTTGSTLNACRAVLRQAFPLPVRISVATLAYVNSD